jgi:hypothetical protein
MPATTTSNLRNFRPAKVPFSWFIAESKKSGLSFFAARLASSLDSNWHLPSGFLSATVAILTWRFSSPGQGWQVFIIGVANL